MAAFLMHEKTCSIWLELYYLAMKYFYRIENDEGVGPYRNGETLDEQGEWHTSICMLITNNTSWNLFKSGRHPTPSQDKIGYIDNSNFIFGFKSLKQVRDWFSDRKDVHKLLKKAGYRLNRYEVGNADRLDGDKQSVMSHLELSNPTKIPFSKLRK